MKFIEIKDMTFTQIWDKMKASFNFAWRVDIMVIAVGVACGLVSELLSFFFVSDGK